MALLLPQKESRILIMNAPTDALGRDILKIINLLERKFEITPSIRPDFKTKDGLRILIMLRDVEDIGIHFEDFDMTLRYLARKNPEIQIKKVFDYTNLSLAVIELEKEYTGEEAPFTELLLPLNFKKISEKIKSEAFTLKEESVDKNGNEDMGAENIKYWITYDDRNIILNNKYLLTKPDFNSENDNFFGFIFKTPRQKITKEQYRATTKNIIEKTFHQILGDLKFVGELRKLFFPNVSSSAIEFRNDIPESELKNIKIDYDELEKELTKLRKIR